MGSAPPAPHDTWPPLQYAQHCYTPTSPLPTLQPLSSPQRKYPCRIAAARRPTDDNDPPPHPRLCSSPRNRGLGTARKITARRIERPRRIFPAGRTTDHPLAAVPIRPNTPRRSHRSSRALNAQVKRPCPTSRRLPDRPTHRHSSRPQHSPRSGRRSSRSNSSKRSQSTSASATSPTKNTDL